MKATTLAMDGLQTDPGPFSGAADGALVEAQNVVIQRRGLIEPRPSIVMSVDATLKAGAYDVLHGRYITGNGDYVWGYNGAAWIMRQYGVQTITGPTAFLQGSVHSDYVKGRFLFTSEDGVCEMPLSGGTVAYRAGLPAPSMPMSLLVTGAGAEWLPNNQSVAYRLVLARRRTDGTLMLSPPTAPLIVRNVTGVAVNVQIVLNAAGFAYTPYNVNSSFDALQTGDELWLYRAPVLAAATGVPSDFMRLRAVLPITAGVVPEFTDRLADADWSGPPLYTNSTQFGALQANTRPSYARDICTYNGMTLYLGYKSPHRVVVTCKAIGDIAADPQQTICTKTITGSVTIGLPDITGLSAADVSYLAVGQYITSNVGAARPGIADAKFPADTIIISINVGAGSAVASANALSTVAAGGLIAWDWISVTDTTVSGTQFRMFAKEAAFATVDDTLWFQAHAGNQMGGYSDLEYRWNNAAGRRKDVLLHAIGSDPAGGAPEFRNVQMTFERASLSTTSFVIRSTKPNAFDRVLDRVTGITSKQEGGDGRIAISRNDIPDAVPLLNFKDVGDSSKAALRVLTLKQSALIFKHDGIFQLYGNAPETLSLELIDNTVLPIPVGDYAGEWITQLGDVAYMMSSRGPMAVTEAGAQPFGQDVLETMRRSFGPAFYLLSSAKLTSVASPIAQHVVFAFGSTALAFNVQTGAWTTWTTRRSMTSSWIGVYGSATFATGYVMGTQFDLRTMLGTPITDATSPASGDYFNAPNTCAVTGAVASGAKWSITITAGSEWTPTVGDTMVVNGVLCVVEVVTSATVFEVSAPSAPGTGTATWVEGLPVRVIWTSRTLGDVGVEKRNVAVSFAFDLRALLLRMKAYFKSNYAPSGVQDTEEPQTVLGWITDDALDATYVAESKLFAPDVITCSVPNDVALDWGLRVGFTLTQAKSWFSLGAVTLNALGSGERVGRNRA